MTEPDEIERAVKAPTTATNAAVESLKDIYRDNVRLRRENETLREDYRALLLAHPDAQHVALGAYCSSNTGDGVRTIDAARAALREEYGA